MNRALALFASLGVAVAALLLTAQPAHTQGSLGPAPLVNVTTGGGLTKTGQKVGMTLCAAGQTPVMNGGGTAWTCGAAGAGDIEGVTAGAGLTGGGTTGTVTLDVACVSNSLVCNANDIGLASRDFGDITTSSSGTVMTIDNSVVTSAKLNITATSACSAGSYINAISSSAVGTCTAEVGDISNVSVTTPLAGGGASGSVNIGMSNGDRGDITQSQTTNPGDTWTVDNSTVTSAKLNITTTSCSAGQHVSAISAGGVGTCSASGSLSGLTTNRITKATSATTIGDSIVTDNGTTVTVAGNFATSSGGTVTAASSVVAGSFLQTNTDGAYFGSSSDAYVSIGSNASYNCHYGTAGTATCRINWIGQGGGTSQFRDLVVGDGKSAAVLTLTGSTKAAAFAADLTVAGNTTHGDADSDSTTERGSLGFAGTDPSVSAGNCTVAGEAQAFTITVTGDISVASPCVIALNRTITGNHCVGSPASAAAGGYVATPGYYITQSTTTATLAPASGTMNASVWNVFCLGDY